MENVNVTKRDRDSETWRSVHPEVYPGPAVRVIMGLRGDPSRPSTRLCWVTLEFEVGAVAIKPFDGHIRPLLL